MVENTSVILDFKSSLKHVDLGIVHPEAKPVSNSAALSNEPGFSKFGSILKTSQHDYIYTLSNCQTYIDITPLGVYASEFQGGGVKIRFDVGTQVNKNSVCLSEEANALRLMFVTTINQVVSVQIQKQWLISYDTILPASSTFVTVHRFKGINLPSLNLLKSLSSTQYIACFNDGSLSLLDLATETEQKFSESGGIGGGLSLTKLLGFSNPKVPGQPDLSLNAVISLAQLNNLLITLSIDGSTKVWSLSNYTCLQNIPKPENQSVLRLIPSEYIGVFKNQIYIVMDGCIKQFNLTSADELEESQSLEYPDNTKNWFFNGLLFDESSNFLIASFKHNLNHCAYKYTIESGWVKIDDYKPTPLLEISIDNNLSSILDRISQYKPEVLAVCASSLIPAQSFPTSIPEFLALGTKIFDVNQWLKLETLYLEMNQRGSELLASSLITTTGNSVVYWTVHSSYVCLHSASDNDRTCESQHLNSAIDSLLSDVTNPEWNEIGKVFIQPALALDVVNKICDLLKHRIDQALLTKIGHENGTQIVTEMLEYYNETKPSLSLNYGNELNAVGQHLVGSLITQHSKATADKYRKLCTILIISIVEGWDPERSDSKLLRECITNYKTFSFFANVPVNSLLSEVTNINLVNLNQQLLRELCGSIDKFNVIARCIPEPPAHFQAQDFRNFSIITSFIDQCSTLTFLRGMAAFCAQDYDLGEKLMRQASVSLPWIKHIDSKPESQSQWFMRVAKIANAYHSVPTALSLGKSAVHLIGNLATSAEKQNEVIEFLHLMFTWSLECSEVDLAYNALCHIYNLAQSQSGFVDEHQLKLMISKLLNTTACLNNKQIYTMVASYPFVGMSNLVLDVLSSVASFGSLPSYKLLYTWFISHEDFVSAAKVVYEYTNSVDLDLERVCELLTICLNALGLADADQRWIVTQSGISSYDDIQLQKDRVIKELSG